MPYFVTRVLPRESFLRSTAQTMGTQRTPGTSCWQTRSTFSYSGMAEASSKSESRRGFAFVLSGSHAQAALLALFDDPEAAGCARYRTRSEGVVYEFALFHAVAFGRTRGRAGIFRSSCIPEKSTGTLQN